MTRFRFRRVLGQTGLATVGCVGCLFVYDKGIRRSAVFWATVMPAYLNYRLFDYVYRPGRDVAYKKAVSSDAKAAADSDPKLSEGSGAA